MTPLKTRILIADDHPIVLRGLRIVLNAQPDLEVTAEASDGEEAVEQALRPTSHLAILDISMPRKTGLQAAREITLPQAATAGADALDARQRAVPLRGDQRRRVRLRLKSAVDRDLVEACRADDARRAVPVSRRRPRADARLPRAGARPARRHRELLTPREEEIVKLVAEAYTNDEIGDLLHISKKTVERHRANVLESSACATASSSPATRSAAG